MDSLRVMLIDDERMVIEDLQSLIDWELHDCSIAATATNGHTALSLYRKIQPQIIFIDICMPVLSGLDIVQQIVESDDNVVIILLSSYRDFKYAQRAISFGVHRYLLKHELNAKSLSKEVINARRLWESNQEKYSLILQKALRELLHCQFEPELRVGRKLGFGTGSKSFYPILFIIQRDIPFSFPFEKNPIDLRIPPLLLPKDLIDDRRFSVLTSLEMSNQTLVYLLRLSSKSDTVNTLTRIRSITSSFAKEILQHLVDIDIHNCSIVFSIPGKSSKSMQNAYKAYERVKQNIFFYSELKGTSSVFDLEDLTVNRHGHQEQIKDEAEIKSISGQLDFSSEIENIFYLLDSFQKEQLKQEVSTLFEILQKSHLEYLRFKEIVMKLFDCLIRFRTKHSLTPIEWDCTLNNHWYRIGELLQWFTDAFLSSLNTCENLKIKQYNYEVFTAVRYINRHYNENLSLEEISIGVGVSRTHMSRLFRKHLNQTFLDYLTNYRIEMSKRLIKTGCYRMYEVSSRVGFSSNQYFSYVFHKVTGFTPKEYASNRPNNIS